MSEILQLTDRPLQSRSRTRNIKIRFSGTDPFFDPFLMKRENCAEIQTQQTLKNVAECLWRHVQSGIYYALFKRKGKQFRRSLRTKDRKLAERKLAVT
jgi:hypothetical protein